MLEDFDSFPPKCRRDLKGLDPQSRNAFFKVFVELDALTAQGVPPSPAFRVKRVVNSPGVWEFTWARNGRATFTYTGDGLGLVLRRVGGHDIFRQP